LAVDPVGVSGEVVDVVFVVAGEDQRSAITYVCSEQVSDALHAVGVEAVEGFVEDENPLVLHDSLSKLYRRLRDIQRTEAAAAITSDERPR